MCVSCENYDCSDGPCKNNEEIFQPLTWMLNFSQLFEMGLELSLARLKALAKFAFGMGLAQVCFNFIARVLGLQLKTC